MGPEGRYELRRVGKSTTTKAAQEQLRQWPNDWSLNMNMPELLETLINDLMQVNNILNRSLVLEPFTLCAVWNVESLYALHCQFFSVKSWVLVKPPLPKVLGNGAKEENDRLIGSFR